MTTNKTGSPVNNNFTLTKIMDETFTYVNQDDKLYVNSWKPHLYQPGHIFLLSK